MPASLFVFKSPAMRTIGAINVLVPDTATAVALVEAIDTPPAERTSAVPASSKTSGFWSTNSTEVV